MLKPHWPPSFTRLSPSSWFLAAALVASGCGTEKASTLDSEGEPARVMVTMDIWADIVANIACQGGSSTGTDSGSTGSVLIETLIPAGSDPHRFEASLSDRTELGQASFIVSNGLSLEASLEGTIASAESDGTPVLRIGDGLDLHQPDPNDADHTDADHTDADHADSGPSDETAHEGHDHGGIDPHIWLDPTLVSAALPSIAEHLIDDAGLDRDMVQGCLSDYQEELEELDLAIDQLLATIPPEQRNIVTNHDSLSYFADRYHLSVIGTVIPSSSSLAETSPATLEALADLIRTTNTTAIFSETQHSDRDAVALGQQLGVQVVPLSTSSLGSAGSQSDTYLSWLLNLASQIATSLTP